MHQRFTYTSGGYEAMRGLERYLKQSGLDAWRECPYYSDRERAALAWTEALTMLGAGDRVPDAVYEQVRQQFSEAEIADLSLAVATINAWNRLAISSRMVPGTYEVRAAHIANEAATAPAPSPDRDRPDSRRR